MRRGRAKVLAMAARLTVGEWPHNSPPGRGVCWRKPGPGVFHRVKRLTRYDYDSAYNSTWPTVVTYPDSRSVTTGYDRLGRVTVKADARGVAHAYSYDSAGRLSADVASAPDGWGGVDSSVQAVGTSYDDLGRVERITSYHDAAGTSVANDVLYAYDGWGNVQSIAQAHDGAADAASPAVHYAYEDGADETGAAAHLRLAEVTYPDGRAVAYNYGVTGGTDDMLSRVASIDNDDATETYAQYAYMVRVRPSTSGG